MFGLVATLVHTLLPTSCCRAISRSGGTMVIKRSEEHTSELQSQSNLVCRLLLEKKKKKKINITSINNNQTKKNIHTVIHTTNNLTVSLSHNRYRSYNQLMIAYTRTP